MYSAALAPGASGGDEGDIEEAVMIRSVELRCGIHPQECMRLNGTIAKDKLAQSTELGQRELETMPCPRKPGV